MATCLEWSLGQPWLSYNQHCRLKTEEFHLLSKKRHCDQANTMWSTVWWLLLFLMRLCWSKLHICTSLQQRACIVIVTMEQRSAKRSLLVIVPLTPSSPSPHSPPHEFLHNRIVTNNQLITFHWPYNQPPRPRSTWCDQHKLGLTLCANSWLGHIWKDLFFFKIGLYHAGSVMDYVLVVPIKYNSRVFFIAHITLKGPP